jgi:hypothetical protein
MKTFKYEIPVWIDVDYISAEELVEAENPPEYFTVFEGEAEFEDYDAAWKELVDNSDYIVHREEVVIEETA